MHPPPQTTTCTSEDCTNCALQSGPNLDIYALHSNCAHLPAGMQSQQAPAVKVAHCHAHKQHPLLDSNFSAPSHKEQTLRCQTMQLSQQTMQLPDCVCHGNSTSLALLARTVPDRTGIRNLSHPHYKTPTLTSKSAVQKMLAMLPLPFLQQSLQLERQAHVRNNTAFTPTSRAVHLHCARQLQLHICHPNHPTLQSPTTQLQLHCEHTHTAAAASCRSAAKLLERPGNRVKRSLDGL